MVDKAVEKVGKGILSISDRLFPGFGIEAEAVQARIEKIKKQELSMDEETALILKAPSEVKWLKNKHSISKKADSKIKDKGIDCSKQNINEDFIDRFMEEAKFVSDEEIQYWWAGVLAGHFEEPDSTPPSITRILIEMKKEYAEIFKTICNLSVTVFSENLNRSHEVLLIPFDSKSKFLEDLNINLNTLNELEVLGLIKTSIPTKYRLDWYNGINHLLYGGDVFTLKTVYKGLLIGNVKLTEAGEHLARLVGNEVIDGYIQYLKESKGLVFEEQATARVEIKENGTICWDRI